MIYIRIIFLSATESKTLNPQPKLSANLGKPAASSKPAAYRPPHTKNAAAINAHVEYFMA